ncbi:unknown [Prevotella sp. CAG:1092]|nr:unknown [Prevotella sp. CAG:1092]
MKKYLIFAASALALASCSSDDFLGENPGNVQNATTAINFGGDAGKITRGTHTQNEGSPAEMLAGQFKVYGVKKKQDNIEHVFPNYYVWDVAAKNTTSNTDGWEYVGKEGDADLGTGKITLDKDQTIKYWDYSASEYHFVAGSPIDKFNLNPAPGQDITSANITGLAGHIEANDAEGTGTALETYPVYVAAPVKVENTGYQKPVEFNFYRQQAMVRVGIYETIPGYNIYNINFYYYDTDGTTLKASDGNNIILTSATPGYFVGGKEVNGTVTYNWDSATPSYTLTYTDASLTKSKNWYAGKLDVLATTSTDAVAKLYGTDKDMSTAGYFTVLPTQAATASPILIKCDYTLFDENTGETIKVTGATAAIPAAFSKWEANTRYTYLFKISDNTNGTTGTPGTSDPAGLFPITFAAVVKGSTDAQYGTTTTVATPSITTYQAGSVTANSIEYNTGKEIDVTVTDAETGEVKDLNTDEATVGSVAVYKFTDAITEAEIQVKGITGATPVTGATIDGKVLKFTPESEGYYAIRYLTKEDIADPATPAVYTYKVVYVKAA